MKIQRKGSNISAQGNAPLVDNVSVKKQPEIITPAIIFDNKPYQNDRVYLL
jgi:hypothetical protein